MLELDTITSDGRESLESSDRRSDAVSLQVTQRERDDLAHGLGEIQRLSVNSSLNNARNREITSAARCLANGPPAVSRAPSTSGGAASNIRTHVLALVMMPDSGWLTSWAIEAVTR